MIEPSPEYTIRPHANNQQTKLEEILGLVDADLLESDDLKLEVQPSQCVLLLHVHLLPSMIPFFQRLLNLGFPRESIVVIGKEYSTIPWVSKALVENMGISVVQGNNRHFGFGFYDHHAKQNIKAGVIRAYAKCRSKDIRRCILVDDGGFLTSTWCTHTSPLENFDIISVQQTESGLYWRRNRSPACRVNVAQSPAKKIFESKLIAGGVQKKIKDLHLLKKRTSIGIIGLGNVGASLAEMLSRRHQVICFDLNPKKSPNVVGRTDSFEECVLNSDVVLGCTGRNIMHHTLEAMLQLKVGKHFISISSRDVEFNSLLRTASSIRGEDPYGQVEVEISNGARHLIYNGGFPINFDRTREWESTDDIALTRGLVLLGILQGLCIKFPAMVYLPEPLALRAQRKLVETWLPDLGDSLRQFQVTSEEFKKRAWWARGYKHRTLASASM